jgi:hypothetical protein
MGDWDVLHHDFECPERASAERIYRRLQAPLGYRPWGEARGNEGWGLSKWSIEEGFHRWALEGVPGVASTLCSLSGGAGYPECAGRLVVTGHPGRFRPAMQSDWPEAERRDHAEAVGFYLELLSRLCQGLRSLPADERSLYLAFGNQSVEHGRVNIGYLWLSPGEDFDHPFHEFQMVGTLNPLERQAWAGSQPHFDALTLESFGVCPEPFGRRGEASIGMPDPI